MNRWLKAWSPCARLQISLLATSKFRLSFTRESMPRRTTSYVRLCFDPFVILSPLRETRLHYLV